MSAVEKKIEMQHTSAEPNSGSIGIVAWLGELLRWMILFPVLRLFATMQVEGREHVCGKGPYVLAANHASHMDTPLLLAALPLGLRLHTKVAAAADYFFATRWQGLLVSM